MLAQRAPGIISIVGAGRVGRTLGRRLRELGWTIGAVVTRSASTARAAVRSIGAGRAHAALTRQIVAADLVLITTPDGEIAGVAAHLGKIGGEEWRGKVALHTSGALDSSVLAPLRDRDAATGSMHPLQTFSGRAAPRLEGCVFALEGTRAAMRMGDKLVRGFGGIAVRVASGDKPAYHAACVLVSGHVLAVVEAATRILMRVGFTRRQAIRALLPLLRQTIANFERFGPGGAWTGPLSRGDFATVSRNVAAMRQFPREYRDVYAALARLSALVLAGKGPAPGDALERALSVAEVEPRGK